MLSFKLIRKLHFPVHFVLWWILRVGRRYKGEKSDRSVSLKRIYIPGTKESQMFFDSSTILTSLRFYR